MRRIAFSLLAMALVLGLAPRRARAQEARSGAPAIVVSRVALDLPARAKLMDPLTDGVRAPQSAFASPAMREVRLSEDGMLVVIGAAVIGVVLLVVVVSAIAS
jgi:hypothetical protein